MALLYLLVARLKPPPVNAVFGKAQLLSSAYMGFSHGSNDAQKTMGIIALALFSATKAGQLDHLPGWLSFLKTSTFEVAVWVKVLCALTMAAGTAAGAGASSERSELKWCGSIPFTALPPRQRQPRS